MSASDFLLKNNTHDFGIQIAMGRHQGFTYRHKFAVNGDLDANVEETVWAFGGDYTFSDRTSLATGFNYFIVSDRSEDTMNVIVDGYDKDMRIQVEEVTLTGTTPVQLPGKWMGVASAFVSTAPEPLGNISVNENNNFTAGVPDNNNEIRACIVIGNNRSLQSVFTIPKDFTGLITSWTLSLNKKQAATCVATLVTRAFGSVFQVRDISNVHTTGSSIKQKFYSAPLVVKELTDIKVLAEAGENDVAMSSTYEVFLIPNKRIISGSPELA